MSPFIDKAKTRYSSAFFQSLFSANFRNETKLNKLAENRDVLSSFFCTNLPLVFVKTNSIIKMEMNKCNFDSEGVPIVGSLSSIKSKTMKKTILIFLPLFMTISCKDKSRKQKIKQHRLRNRFSLVKIQQI
ncbi:hypothetical protein SAMN02787100_1347 [Chryseobacterium sp. OV279]|nr:hypothetical protein SAMN02787100_1347 [Chryseobacterium sp. OV279]